MSKIDYSYETILRNWDVKKEQQKADFMERMYQCYQPANHCYTGLWERFCMEEVGPHCRNEYFNRIEAIEQLKETIQNSPNTDLANV